MNAPVTLRRVLKFRTVVSTSTGLAYAAISFLGCVQLASLVGGDSGWIAIVIAGILAVLPALCFSELNSLYPTAAGVRQFMKEAFNENFSLIVTFGYMLTVITVIAADSYIVGSAITYAFNLPNWASLIWILALLGLAMGANLRGIKLAGLLQDITTYSLLAFAIIISLIALFNNHFQLHNPLDALYHPDALVNAVAVGVFVFSAFEWVTPLSEEIANIKLIPRGMFIALALLAISYALFTLAASALLNVHSPAIYNSPVPQMLLSQAALGQVGIWLMLIATLLTAVMTFNGGFATASRFLYAAAREDTLPQIFSRISIVFAVPYFAVIFLTVSSAVIAVIIFLTGQFNALILFGAVLEALIYTVAGLCVLRLRRKKPAAERIFRIKGGWTLPVLTIVIFGALAILASLGIGSNIMPGLPLIISIGVFLLSALYVFLVVPRIRAAAQARRAATGRRRPTREATGTETGQG
ncbi:MAG TPA: APC family permease [Ktedonobacteraceae bacterium]|nr:APC family permease [Ktedonobacteraceae bacterium]